MCGKSFAGIRQPRTRMRKAACRTALFQIRIICQILTFLKIHPSFPEMSNKASCQLAKCPQSWWNDPVQELSTQSCQLEPPPELGRCICCVYFGRHKLEGGWGWQGGKQSKTSWPCKHNSLVCFQGRKLAVAFVVTHMTTGKTSGIIRQNDGMNSTPYL